MERNKSGNRVKQKNLKNLKRWEEGKFISKECAEAIAKYQQEKTDANLQKLKDILKGEKAEDIEKAYKKMKKSTDKRLSKPIIIEKIKEDFISEFRRYDNCKNKKSTLRQSNKILKTI